MMTIKFRMIHSSKQVFLPGLSSPVDASSVPLIDVLNHRIAKFTLPWKHRPRTFPPCSDAPNMDENCPMHKRMCEPDVPAVPSTSMIEKSNNDPPRPAPDQPQSRSIRDILDMGIVVQANLVQLRVAESKRSRSPRELHDIKVDSPGHVARSRDSLIDYRRINVYSDLELRLRIREIWGQYCLFTWALRIKDQPADSDIASIVRAKPIELPRCQAELDVKEAEIEAMLWALRFEQERRVNADLKVSPDYRSRSEAASRIPVRVFGQSPADADDQALLLGACEYAGMLAAVRWIGDGNWEWGHQQIMNVRDLYRSQDSD
jgi:hypothetical protein